MLKLLLIAIFSWVLWRVFGQALKKNPLANIRGSKPTSFWTGCLFEVFSKDSWEYHTNLMKNYGGVAKIDMGVMGSECLYIYDPKALHHVVVKDQPIFEAAPIFLSFNTAVFGTSILSTVGSQHRKHKKMLTPALSINHMRDMSASASNGPLAIPSIFHDVAHKLQRTLSGIAKDGPQEVDLLQWCTRTAVELMGQSGLGWSFDNLDTITEPHPYATTVQELVAVASRVMAYVHLLLPLTYKLGPASFRRSVINAIPSKSLHRLRDMADFMYDTSVEIYQAKKAALEQGGEAMQQQVGQGKDLISILMKENMKESGAEKLDEHEIISQMSSLIFAAMANFAAMDTTSSALARTFHVLSLSIKTPQRRHDRRF